MSLNLLQSVKERFTSETLTLEAKITFDIFHLLHKFQELSCVYNLSDEKKEWLLQEMLATVQARACNFGQSSTKLGLVPDANTAIRIDVDKNLYINVKSVQEKLKPIVEQLKSCQYECEGGCLEKNVAFIQLNEIANGNVLHASDTRFTLLD